MIATLLDFDGVLVDSEPVHLAAFNDVLSPLGMAIEEGDYMRHYLSLDDAGVFRAVLSRQGGTLREEQVRGLVASKGRAFMARFTGGLRIFPGAEELVRRRATLGTVGIVSGALEREITFALERMGVRSEIAFIVSAESSPACKPDPAPYRAALNELRTRGTPGRALAPVVVEDSVGGVQAAKRAELRCVAVAHSCSTNELRQAGADEVANDLAGLTDALLDGALPS